MMNDSNYNTIGHDEIKKYLSQFESNIEKIPQNIMFSGLVGIGKFNLAYNFAKSFTNGNSNDDIFILSKESDANEITIDQVRKMIEFSQMTPKIIAKKFVIIDDISVMNINSFNAILKILEEPTKSTVFILINNDSAEIPDTILSRCQNFKFKSHNFNNFKEILNNISNFKSINEKLLLEYYKISKGSIILAIHLNEVQFLVEGILNGLKTLNIAQINKSLKEIMTYYKTNKLDSKIFINLIFKIMVFCINSFSIQEKEISEDLNTRIANFTTLMKDTNLSINNKILFLESFSF